MLLVVTGWHCVLKLCLYCTACVLSIQQANATISPLARASQLGFQYFPVPAWLLFHWWPSRPDVILFLNVTKRQTVTKTLVGRHRSTQEVKWNDCFTLISSESDQWHNILFVSCRLNVLIMKAPGSEASWMDIFVESLGGSYYAAALSTNKDSPDGFVLRWWSIWNASIEKWRTE